jgi:hypothetical protein
MKAKDIKYTNITSYSVMLLILIFISLMFIYNKNLIVLIHSICFERRTNNLALSLIPHCCTDGFSNAIKIPIKTAESDI